MVTKKERSESYDSAVFEQDCAQYLSHLGFDVVDGDGINCPYRPSSDSGAFVVNGPKFFDHATGDGGNVWQLALRMNGGDKRRALESLCKSAGVPFIADAPTERVLGERDKALQALKKVYDAFAITPEKTPAHVQEYLKKRMVTDKTRHLFGFIPKGELAAVLSEEEIALTGLKHREELIILWYLDSDKPAYYCTRDIATKDFKKASREGGVLEHPIWNGDALYRDAKVVWGEGMFDCTSLMELGFGVAGEITCHLINEHRDELLKALRWRLKNHPDWTFTICLDNDKPTADGRRPGNDAAEKIAVWLWSRGVDVRWVKHNPGDEKVDINQLHQNALGAQVCKMIEEAKPISQILTYDEELCLRNLPRMMAYQDYRGADRLVALIQANNAKCTIGEVMRKMTSIPWAWRDIYGDDIKELFVFTSDIYAVFAKDRFGQNDKHYEVFKSTDLIRNLRKFQRNPTQQVTVANLDLHYRRPTWRVSKGGMKSKDEFNLFAPSALLLQEPKANPADAPLPEIWSLVFDNLAGKAEKEWLLNHMAVYVQTLNKPRTIPVLVGRQGTGKTAAMHLFGDGIGGYMAVDNALIESQFNGYLMNAVVLLDELANSQRDSNQLKNRLKQLINETQSINEKHLQPVPCDLNNYIVIASNEQSSHVPLVIEKGDRRYSVIAGGKDKDLAHEAWFEFQKLKDALPAFMLYLLSRPIDEDAASVPLMTEKKQQITDAGQDYKSALVRDYIEEMQATATMPQTLKLTELCNQINEKRRPQYQYTSRAIRPILEDLGCKITFLDHQLAVTVEPLGFAEPIASSEVADGDNPPASGSSGSGGTSGAASNPPNSPDSPNPPPTTKPAKSATDDDWLGMDEVGRV